MVSDIDEQVALLQHNADNFKLVMTISGGFTAFSTLMSIYLIVFKSSDAMKYYKPFLLNIVVSFLARSFNSITFKICCGIFDLFLTLIYTPNILLPMFGACIEGLVGKFKYWNLSIVLFVSFPLIYTFKSQILRSEFFF
jgi:hypothetical protein